MSAKAIETEEEVRTLENTKKALLKIPRIERAKVQGMNYQFQIGGHLVTRTSRYYWSVSGTDMKLSKAVETIGGIASEA